MALLILVADDSTTIQKVIKIAFARYPVAISEAATYVEALAVTARSRPAALIVDASLPGAKGPADLVKLRQEAGQAPVLILIGTYDAVDEAGLRQAGFSHILKKPFDTGDITARLEALLGEVLVRNDQAEPAPAVAPQPPGRSHHAVIHPGGLPGRDAAVRQASSRSEAALEEANRARAEAGQVSGPVEGQDDDDHEAYRSSPPRRLNSRSDEGDYDDLDRLAQAEAAREQKEVREQELRAREQREQRSKASPPPSAPAAHQAYQGHQEMPAPPLTDDAQRGRRAFAEAPSRSQSSAPVVPPPLPATSKPPPPPLGFTTAGQGDRYPPRGSDAAAANPGYANPQPPKIPLVSAGAAADVRAAAGLPPRPSDTPRTPATAEILADELPPLVRQAVEDYCERHFKSLAREIIAAELRRLADDKARHLVDN